MKAAITGATGIVGHFVVERLLAEGVEIRALVRQPSDTLPGAVQQVAGDLASGAGVAELVVGADAVVHCAYQHAPGRYRGGEGNDRFGYWRANLLAGVELMERARLAGVARLVLLSSRAVFGRDSGSGGWVDDAARPVPDTHYGALKLALEAHASAFAAADGVCYASLRPTGVYGLVRPVARSKWFDLARAVARRQPLPPARLATEVHGADVAAAVWLLLTAPAAQVAGRAFNCSDLTIDSRDVMARLAAHAGVPANLPPPATNPLPHPMRATALRALGWRPGGQRRLERTMEELIAALETCD